MPLPDIRAHERLTDAVTSPLLQRFAWPVIVTLAIVAFLGDPSDPLWFIAAGGSVLAASGLTGLATNARIGAIAGLGLAIVFMSSVEVRSPEVASPALWILSLVTAGGTAALTGMAATAIRSEKHSRHALRCQLDESERGRQIDRALAECAQSIALAERLTGAAYAAFQRLLEALALDVLIIRRNVDLADGGLGSEVKLWVTRSDDPETLDRSPYPLEWEQLPSIRRSLERNESYAFSSLADLPPSEGLYLSQGPARLQAAMNLPIWSGGNWLGHVAFAQRQSGRTWTPKEVASLRVISDMIGTMWLRDLHTAELESSVVAQRRALNAQHALTEGTRILLSPDSDQPLAETLRLVMEALSGDVAYIEEFGEDDKLGRFAKPIYQLYRDPSHQADDCAWPLSSEPAGSARLLAGQVFKFDDQEELNIFDPDRVEWLEHPLVAEINVPLRPDGETTFVVGVGCFSPRRWTDSDVDVMTSLGRMLGAYFQREETTKKLEDLVSAKDRFIASVSHELRTPLSVVVGLAAELDREEDIFSEQERREFMGMIRRQSREVSDIIDDLLVSTRINETSLTVFPEEFQIDQLVEQVISDLRTDVTSQVTVVTADPVMVVADPVRTRQIVRNLVTNAHRYGGDEMFVSIRSDGGLATVDVADNGDGVPPERRDSIFDAYHTSGEERIVTAAIGLGLTVSRQLARLMDGDVGYIHDPMPTFRLSLPLAAAVDAKTTVEHRAQAF